MKQEQVAKLGEGLRQWHYREDCCHRVFGPYWENLVKTKRIYRINGLIVYQEGGCATRAAEWV